ncbi:MSC_0882 family membrane protein [Metamycoplasma neophronis]|uniref:DUF975 family protein n=1 Tax=Metamycoplasma neophronis TaxID=872983 RepID=A0ABY2Z0H9_9BACT|nr:hypothetical protein [Metamycoplasma neophronis]TPR53528.1 hypothetical protein FJR74_02415 [Metamycoplasma neophronis]
MFNFFKKKNQQSNVPNVNGIDQNQSKPSFDYESTITPQKKKTLLSIFRKEVVSKTFAMLFWLIFVIASIAGAIATYFLITAKEDSKSNGAGYYTLCGIIFLFSLILFIVYAVKLTALKMASRSLRTNIDTVDANIGFHLFELYRSLVLKKLRIIWIYAFFLTYYGIFNLIVFGLSKAGIWSYSKQGVDFQINFPELLKKAFGNVNILLIIGASIICGITLLFIIIQIHLMRRINEVKYNLGGNVLQLTEIVKNDRKNENKNWLISYWIIFAIVFLVPLLLIGYLIWKGVIRKKS